MTNSFRLLSEAIRGRDLGQQDRVGSRSSAETAQTNHNSLQQKPLATHTNSSRMKNCCVLAVVLLVTIVVTQAHKGEQRQGGSRLAPPPPGRPGPGRRGPGKGDRRPGGRGPRPGNFSIESFSWNRQSQSGEETEERADVLNDSQIIIFKSIKNNTSDKVVYIFTDNLSRAVIVPNERNSPCILYETSSTFEQIVDSLKARNDTDIPAGPEARLNATSAPLNRAERQNLTSANHVLGKFCARRPIVQAELDSSAQSSDNSTEELDIQTLEFRATIIIQARPSAPIPPPGGHRHRGPHSGEDSSDSDSREKSRPFPPTRGGPGPRRGGRRF